MLIRSGHREGRASAVVAIVATVALLAYAAAFYPGAMSFDAAYQWWQARGGTTSNLHGVGMVGLWRATRLLGDGPGGLFLVQLAMFWTGLALIATGISARTGTRLAVLCIAAAPVVFVLLSHVWSDALLIAVLTFASGALLHATRRGRRAGLIAAFVALAFALTLRHNTLPAIVPLLAWLVDAWIAPRGPPRRRAVIGITLAAAAALQLASLALERTVDERRSLFAATALWDLAAVSLERDTLLLPAASHAPDLTLDDLAQAFAPYSNTPLFERTRAGMRQPFFAPDDPLNSATRAAWFDAIATYPRAYLAHRWRVTQALFGRHPRDWPRELVFFDGEFQFKDNPPVAPNATSAHAWCIAAFESLRDGIWLAAWPYFVLALIALAGAWRARRRSDQRAAFAVLTSGLAYALPLVVIAPAAELRYVGWSCAAALLGTALMLFAPRRRSH